MIFGIEKVDLILRAPYAWMLAIKILVVVPTLGCAVHHATKARQQIAGVSDILLDQTPVESAI